MGNAGIEIDSGWVRRGEGDFDNGYQMTLDLFNLPPSSQPTAIISMNDLMAIGAMTAIRSKGLEPGKHIAVTGFDDTPTARYLNPPLTTLRQPVSKIGKNLMVRFINYLETGCFAEPICELITPELIIRESTTGIPAKYKQIRKEGCHNKSLNTYCSLNRPPLLSGDLRKITTHTTFGFRKIHSSKTTNKEKK